MASILDRLFPRAEPHTKAVTGPGAYALTWHPSIRSLSRNPHKLMAEGEALYHSQPWVAACERALVGRFGRMAWHLETEDGDTVDKTSPEPQRAVQRLLQRPNDDLTWRALVGLTFRHLGLTGNAYWYLDQTDDAGQPLRIMYINPARMTPVKVDGVRAGYILDARDNSVSGGSGTEPVPFDKSEIIHFRLDEPDWGDYGIGIPESAQVKIELDRLASTHAGGVLGTGGRLTGLVTPKTGEQMSDDQWVQFSRDWRRIAEDPDAAKRLQIAKVPLDFTQTTASPKDLQLVDIAGGARDDILAIWGVPKSQLGMNVPSGLNADRSEADDQAIWETIKHRAVTIEEVVQYTLLDRFELGLQLIFDYPEFDDNAPLFENAVRSRYLALTNNERRALTGHDPLEDEELGAQIWIASDLVRLDEEEEPEPAPPAILPAIPTNTPAETEVVEDAKAKLDVTRLRQRAEDRYVPRIQEAMRVALADQRSAVVGAVKRKYGHLTVKVKDTDAWWNEQAENARLERALVPILDDLTIEAVRNLRTTLVIPAMKADPNLERILRFVKTQAAQRIAGINATTRDAIAKLIGQGIADGASVTDLTRAIEEATAFNNARAELISRTETALAYNESALTTFREYGAEEVEAIDGDDDPECAHRHGARYPVGEALSITDHPNGTLDWVPVVKAAPDPLLLFAEAMKANLERPLPVPVVNNYLPEITVQAAKAPNVTVRPPDVHNHFEPAVVNVTVPEQPAPTVTVNVPEAKATGPAEVVVTKMPNRLHRAIRNEDGTIDGSIEGDA